MKPDYCRVIKISQRSTKLWVKTNLTALIMNYFENILFKRVIVNFLVFPTSWFPNCGRYDTKVKVIAHELPCIFCVKHFSKIHLPVEITAMVSKI